MLKYLEIITFVLALGPKLIEVVTAVEKMFPASGQGVAKLEFVKNMVKGIFETLGNVKVTFEEVWPSIEKVVASIVAFANTVGLFKKNA